MSDDAPHVPICTQKMPYVIEEEPGKKAWCACGKSANQPYCDGSHVGTGCVPVVVEITEKKHVAWCGCRKTGNAPFCDGTHSKS